jgi:hypothetical protein
MSSSSGGGSSSAFCSLLQVLFIGLKLTGHITWSWVWVLGPTWIPLAILLAILLVWGIVAVAGHVLLSLVTKR